MTLRFAYDTRGAASHRLDDAIRLIESAGYDGVTLTLDIHHLDPFADGWAAEAGRVASLLENLGLGCVVGTGARFLLDPNAKHEPTLVTADAAGRGRRIGFLKRAVEIGAILGTEAVSFRVGVPKPDVDRAEARRWLIDGLHAVVAFAVEAGIVPCLEPKPGTMIETLDDFSALDVPGLKLALDLGHGLVTGGREPAAAVRDFAGRIGTVALADRKRGAAARVPFGEGDIDVPGVLAALEAIAFDKLVCVALPRESHRADAMIPQALDYLRACRRPGPELTAEQETRRQWP